SLISESDNKYTLIYDELDDRFRNEEVYKHSIISLLKAADKINLELYDTSPNSKIIILLRTDIFALLNDPDLNKIKRCNGVTIDWGRKNNKDSPLFD
ncbi:hypothetical protein CHH67_25790, partial [Paenibacillus campinasensis]